MHRKLSAVNRPYQCLFVISFGQLDLFFGYTRGHPLERNLINEPYVIRVLDKWPS